jgi:hypothetical protein
MKKSLLAFLIAAAPLCLFAQLPSYLPTEGLVGWWPFNGNANDESGNGNHGTVNGLNLIEDRFGNINSAFLFMNNSIAQNITTNLIGPSGNASRSISIWFNQNNSVPPNSLWVLCGYGSLTGVGTSFVPNIGTNNKIGLDINSANIYYESNTFGNWNNCVFVYESEFANSIANVKIYLNSVLMNNVIYQTGSQIIINTGNSLPFIIGDVNNDQQFDGSIDDIAIYNRALTPSEITALYTGVPTDNNGDGNAANATVPAAISYQAVARNAQGQPLSDAAVQVKFTLLTDSLTGATEYSESHSLTTNSLGLFNTAFGAGTPESGTFAGINWASGSKYLKVELDAGTGFVDMGTQQLLSVPYSMRSNTSAKAGTIENAGLPVYADNTAALAGGLVAGQMYRTPSGVLMIVY